jgi:hypothetical protein
MGGWVGMECIENSARLVMLCKGGRGISKRMLNEKFADIGCMQ